jgi:CubicO group peptidase (beta-lactamase class C family)
VVCAAQESKLSSGKLAQIDAAVSKFMSTTHVPGLSVAVVENGGYEWAQGFGVADLENNVPSTEHTLFRLASISKSLTATAAMQLWERGQLDLDAPVQEILPFVSSRTVAHFHSPGSRAPGRDSPLQIQFAG